MRHAVPQDVSDVANLTSTEAIYYYFFYPIAEDENYRHAYRVRLWFSSVDAPRIDKLAELLFAIEQANYVGMSLISERRVASKRRLKRALPDRPAIRVPARDQVRVDAVSMQSPLDITLILSSLGGVWVLVQIIDKIKSWSLAKAKNKLEMRKLELEIHKLMLENKEKEQMQGAASAKELQVPILANLATDQRALGSLKVVLARLERSEFHLEGIEVTRTDTPQLKKSNS